MTSLTCESCDRRVSPGRRIDGEKILPPDCCRYCGRPQTEVALHRAPVAFSRVGAACTIRLTSVARAYGA